ncbi:twin-arginine translocation signal domain-containing protein [Spirillospora sp. CA-108201]
MGEAKITRRAALTAAAAGGLLAVTRGKDEKRGTNQQQAPCDGKSNETKPQR